MNHRRELFWAVLFFAAYPVVMGLSWLTLLLLVRTGIALAPYTDVLLVQVAAPVVVALLWRRGRGQRAKGWR